MKRAEYAAFDAIGLAELVRAGEVTGAEVVSAALDAINHVNPTIKAIIDPVEPALSCGMVSADGRLAGVPFLLKDLGVFRAGARSEAGSGLCRDFRPPFTSTLVERYDRAGLISLGRTKSPEFGFSPTTEPRHHGPAHNPWNLAYSPGGSSGGAAAAVAAGCVPVAHANDAGGSIRIPASCCGLFGLKPSRGRVPVGPAFAEAVCGLGADHVVSRSVRDSALILDLTRGAASGDPYGIARTISSYLGHIERPLEELRIGLWRKPWSGVELAPDVAKALQAAANLCTQLGHHVEFVEPDFGVPWDSFLDANATIWCTNLAALIQFFSRLMRRQIDSEHLEEQTLVAYEYGKRRLATDMLAAANVFNAVSRAIGTAFTQFDVLLSPVMTRTTPLLGQFVKFTSEMSATDWCRCIFDQLPFTPLFNVTGGTAASVPFGQDQHGLPIGIQIGATSGMKRFC
ncbi:amidase [Bradyrhizobium tropiciagri]|uniref:amidase n=1 Tax=Bradyrhizobium tropiciagri TaxID=312253 RepID=UPI00067B48D6|nr:amidase family protein [Bradyrhizobium tropiciagri]